MGSQQSVPASRKKRSSVKRGSGSSSNSTNDVSRSTLADFDGDVGEAIDPESVAKWEELLLSDPKNQLALSALSTHDPTTVLANPAVRITDRHVFNVKIEFEGSPVTNQRSSGRCWLFAATNVMRIKFMKKQNLSKFEFSQNYLFFWDKLEKANWFIEQIIDTTDEPTDGRLIAELLSAPVGDGGQWDMAVSLIEKYGLVPQDLYPDSFNSKASRAIGSLITRKLRESVPELRRLASESTEKGTPSPALLKFKSQILREIHSTLVLSLGAPPSPSTPFTWEYTDKESKYHSLTTTPLEFYQSLVSFPAASHFSLVNDPRNEYYTHLTVSRLGNVIAGSPISYTNVPLSTLKDTAIKMLKKGIPVFFGADVGVGMDKANGILANDIFLYQVGFNLTLSSFGATAASDAEDVKKTNLTYNISKMNHAMVLTGVHLDPEGNPVRWRVENSWGEASGKGGYYVMSDEWFGVYVYQVVTEAQWVEKKVEEVRRKEAKVLPLWDPMGALA